MSAVSQPDDARPASFADYAREAQRLGRGAFTERYGSAFLLLHAADLRGGSPGETSVPTARGATAATTFHVFAVTLTGRQGRGWPTLGRADENDIVVQDTTISRVHVGFIGAASGGYSVVDLGSSNGTFVDDQAVPLEGAGEPLALPSRSTLRCGSVNFKFMEAPEFLEFVAAFLGPVR
ncbi:MAG: FHA domain-containing protein [Myxococcota bacterium]